VPDHTEIGGFGREAGVDRRREAKHCRIHLDDGWGTEPMPGKLFVANFPYTTSSDALRDLFAPYGPVVSVKIATDRETGRSRGFGFVEMETEDACTLAIEKLNGADVGGRPLAVRRAEDRPREGGGGGRGGFDRPPGRGAPRTPYASRPPRR
jgi:RNA recognition motif-containing protein